MPRKEITVLFAVRDYAGEPEVFAYAKSAQELTFAVCEFYSGVLTPAAALSIGEQIQAGMREAYYQRVNVSLRNGSRLTFVVQYGIGN